MQCLIWEPTLSSLRELTKINRFYSEKLAEATRKFATLKSELVTSSEPPPSDRGFLRAALGRRRKSAAGGGDAAMQQRDRVPQRKMQELKLAFSEYYLSLVLLQNYQNLNFTGEELTVCHIFRIQNW